MNALDSTSTRPYLIRALYEWCNDNGFTPYVAVSVDETVQVPREYVKNNEIVLNVSFDATSSLKLGNDFIEFKARFAGSSRDITVPIGRVMAIYARENGQGMAFPMGSPPNQNSTPSSTALLSVVGAPRPDPNLTELNAAASPDLKPLPVTKLGSEPTSGQAESRVVQLVATDDHDPPKPPKPPTTPRPSLKRVK